MKTLRTLLEQTQEMIAGRRAVCVGHDVDCACEACRRVRLLLSPTSAAVAVCPLCSGPHPREMCPLLAPEWPAG